MNDDFNHLKAAKNHLERGRFSAWRSARRDVLLSIAHALIDIADVQRKVHTKQTFHIDHKPRTWQTAAR